MNDISLRRSRLLGGLRLAWGSWTRLVRILSAALFGTLLLASSVLFFNYVVVSTPKDQPYRDLDPATPVCAEGLAHGWTILADRGIDALATGRTVEGDGWRDPSDNEMDAVAFDPAWSTRLCCAVQRHIVPARRSHG